MPKREPRQDPSCGNKISSTSSRIRWHHRVLFVWVLGASAFCLVGGIVAGLKSCREAGREKDETARALAETRSLESDGIDVRAGEVREVTLVGEGSYGGTYSDRDLAVSVNPAAPESLGLSLTPAFRHVGTPAKSPQLPGSAAYGMPCVLVRLKPDRHAESSSYSLAITWSAWGKNRYEFRLVVRVTAMQPEEVAVLDAADALKQVSWWVEHGNPEEAREQAGQARALLGRVGSSSFAERRAAAVAELEGMCVEIERLAERLVREGQEKLHKQLLDETASLRKQIEDGHHGADSLGTHWNENLNQMHHWMGAIQSLSDRVEASNLVALPDVRPDLQRRLQELLAILLDWRLQVARQKVSEIDKLNFVATQLDSLEIATHWLDGCGDKWTEVSDPALAEQRRRGTEGLTALQAKIAELRSTLTVVAGWWEVDGLGLPADRDEDPKNAYRVFIGVWFEGTREKARLVAVPADRADGARTLLAGGGVASSAEPIGVEGMRAGKAEEDPSWYDQQLKWRNVRIPHVPRDHVLQIDVRLCDRNTMDGNCGVGLGETIKITLRRLTR